MIEAEEAEKLRRTFLIYYIYIWTNGATLIVRLQIS